jgi:aryl carrier-like protein
MSMPHPLELVAFSAQTAAGVELVATWTWAGALLTEADVAELAEEWLVALRGLAAHATSPEAGGLTPSDVYPAGVDQAELDRLEAGWGGDQGLADVLPVTPLQQGLLFHARYDRAAPDVYFVQQVLELDGPLNPEPVRAACQALVDRHSALRAGFVTGRTGEPLQVIARTVPVPWIWRDLGDGSGEEELEAYLEADRLCRFDPERPPLLRFSLLRLAAERHVLVFTSHHLLADGWSAGLLLRDLVGLLGRIDPAPDVPPLDLPAPVPVRRYVEWLAGRDRAAAAKAWRNALAGLDHPTLVAGGAETAGAVGAAGLPTLPRRLTAELSAEQTGALGARARACGLTLNSVIQGAWAVLLAELTGAEDVVFGATVSVRPPELPGVEEVVGLLISTVPVRVRLRPGQPLAELCEQIQAEQADLADHVHLGPAAIQRLAGLGPLYDSCLVFENFPQATEAAPPAGAGPRIAGFSGRDAYHYPLKLMVVPEARLYLEVSYRPELFPTERAEWAYGRLVELLDAFAAAPATPVGTVRAGAPHFAATPAPLACRAGASPAPAAPAALVERVAALAAEVLQLETLAPEDDFFEAGGDSLTALRLAERIRTELGQRLDLKTIYGCRKSVEIAASLAHSLPAVGA